MAGLTNLGLVIKRQPEIIEDLVERERQYINPNINTQPDELLGQLNLINSLSLAELWELAQIVADNADPMKAEGIFLDKLAVLVGINRNDAAKSNTNSQLFYGRSGTTVPYGVTLENPSTLDKFITTRPVTLSASTCNEITFRVGTILADAEYTITVNGRTYTYTSSNSPTARNIMSGIKTVMDVDSTAPWTTSVDVLDSTLTIVSDNLSEKLNVFAVSYLTVAEVGCTGSVEALSSGPINVPINSVVNILTPVVGLFRTRNPEVYNLGSLEETDEDFRQRILNSQQINGKATLGTITSNLGNVAGVTAVTVNENSSTVYSEGKKRVSFAGTGNVVISPDHGYDEGTPVRFTTTGKLPDGLFQEERQYWMVGVDPDSFQLATVKDGTPITFTGVGSGAHFGLFGMPPKSIEAIVQGGTNEEVASVLWEVKGAGIETFGNTTETILDSYGIARTVKLTRPLPVYLAFKVEYTLYDEELFPSNGESLIAETVLSTTEELGIDEDVIPSRYFGPIYRAVSGIDSLEVYVQKIESPSTLPTPSNWQTSRLPIDAAQFASTTSSNISVTVVEEPE